MTGIVIFGVTILLLVLALEPANRRIRRGAPGAGRPDVDRDRQRLLADLRDRAPLRETARRRHLSLPHLGRHSAVRAHGHRA